MRHHRCEWTWRSLKGWSPRREAAARRAVAKEASRVEAKRDEVALFPELQTEIQPAFTSVDERKEAMDDREILFTRTIRTRQAQSWRQARNSYFALPSIRRAGALRLWQKLNQPCGPADLATFVKRYEQPGNSPWTYLRKMRLIWLWNHGGLTKPTHFRVITSNFNTLGSIPSLRLFTQDLLILSRLRNQSLRTIRAEFQTKMRSIQQEF